MHTKASGRLPTDCSSRVAHDGEWWLTIGATTMVSSADWYATALVSVCYHRVRLRWSTASVRRRRSWGSGCNRKCVITNCRKRVDVGRGELAGRRRGQTTVYVEFSMEVGLGLFGFWAISMRLYHLSYYGSSLRVLTVRSSVDDVAQLPTPTLGHFHKSIGIRQFAYHRHVRMVAPMATAMGPHHRRMRMGSRHRCECDSDGGHAFYAATELRLVEVQHELEVELLQSGCCCFLHR